MTDLAERYGAPSRTTRPVVVAVAVLLALAGLGWLVWAIAFHGRPEVTSELAGYDVRGPHLVQADFVVARRDTDVRASCLLRAVAEDHAIVGERSVAVAAGRAQQRLTRTVRTERRASSVDLVGCRASGQRAPR